MKVTTPGGEVIDLGTTETTPTIGIKDYSRRVTDDYGLTTVVPRGFSRRMSVRLGVAVDAVDALQRRLADLRATSARWVADRRYAALSVQGFFSDFSIDLPGAPLSYCTLTIEGLVENEALLDNGADPAPYGRSTMQVLAPIAITDVSLVASSVSETDYAAWSSGTSYGKGARVILAATHRIYESAVDGNAGNDPAGTSGKWLDIGPTNRWAMFDQALGSATTAQGSIAVTVTGVAIGAIALLDVAGATVRVQTASYDRTVPVGAGAITFLDLPPATTRATVTITGADTVSVGTLLAGKVVGLGITEAGAGAGITDYSRKEVDDFGAVTIVERAWAKRMTAKTLIDTAAIDAVFGRLAAVRATPVLWMGSKGLDSLTIYGFFKDFSIEVGETLSKVSLSIEGLSTAGKVQPFAPGGGSVAWPDITDPDGTKPKPNADQTSQNTAKDTAAVGGKPAGDVLSDLSSVAARATKLEKETIPAINSAVTKAGERINAAQGAADAAKQRADGAFNEIAARVTDINERFDSIEQNGGYDDTAVKTSIIEVDRAATARDAALAEQVRDVGASIQTTDTNLRALVSTKEQAAVDRETAISQRLDKFIAEGGGGSDGVDTVARAEIQRVEQASVTRDNALTESVRTMTARQDVMPVSFRLVSTGARTPIPAGQPVPGIYNAAGQQIMGANRGWNIAVWNAANQITQIKSFDTLGGLYDGGAQAMADFLNTLPDATTVTIHTADEPATNHSLQALIDAVARCGGGAAFTSQGWAYRGAYVLVGRTGIGRGNGVEIYRGTPAGAEGATDAYISHGFSLLVGVPQTSGAGSVIEATARDITRTFTEANTALASKMSALEASASAASASVVFNDNFSFWADGQGLPAHWGFWAAQGNFRVERLSPGRGGGRYCVRTLNDVANVESGFVQTIYTAGPGKWVVEVTIDKPGGSLQGAGVTLHGIWNIDFCADPDTNGKVGDSSDGEVRSWSKMFDIDARDQINVHAMHGWAGFGRTINPKYLTWHCLRLRPATDGEIKAGKADAALFGAGGVLARIKTSEDTLADLPNQYAAASRAGLIEAQLRREQPSALNSYVDAVSGKADQVRIDMTARIEERASAIADAKVGAVTQSVSNLRSEYNGTASTVSQQAGTIVDLQSRASAYIKLLADAGGGVASLSLWSDQFGGAWELAGNGRIRGNLLVDGEITTSKIASGGITQSGAAQTNATQQVNWNDANEHIGISITLSNTTGAGVRIDFRYNSASGGQGGGPPFNVNIQRVVSDGSSTILYDIGFFGGILLDYPPAAAWVQYRFRFKHQYAVSNGGTSTLIYQQLFALELKR